MGKNTIEIDRDKLIAFMYANRKRIEASNVSGIAEILAAVTLILTTLCSDISVFEDDTFNKLIKVALFIIAIIQFIYGIYLCISSNKHYEVTELCDDICSCTPDNTGEHSFNIIVIKNRRFKGNYLLHKKKNWNCFLFPDFKVENVPYDKTKEGERLLEKIADNIGGNSESLSVELKRDFVSTKFSENDKIFKKYHFYIWEALFNDNSIKWKNSILTKRVKMNGHTFKWMTLDGMYKNKDMVRKNKDVLDEIRAMELS